MADPDLQKRGGGRGGAVCKKKFFFRPFGSQFGLNIRGARAPQAPPLDPPLLMTWLVLDQTQTLTQTREVRRGAETPKGDRAQFAASLNLWITD